MPDNILAERPAEVLKVALVVALVCALLVSFAAIFLRPYYLANIEAERMARLTLILDALPGAGEIQLGDIELRAVNLGNGIYADNIDPATYDARQAAKDASASVAIPHEYDIAGIRRRASHAVVYLLRESDNSINALILPVRGVGYQSALYGYLALDGDGEEILALKFYQQGETPGLGSQIQNPSWEAQWPGKQIYDFDGKVDIDFDSISGATRTSNDAESCSHLFE